QRHRKILSGNYRLAESIVHCARKQHADAVDFEPVETLDHALDDPVLAPPHKPKGRGSVEEVMLARALPDKVPWIVLVHSQRPAPVSVSGMEAARTGFLEIALPVGNRVRVIARRRRHEADAKHAAVRRVAKAFNRGALASASF